VAKLVALADMAQVTISKRTNKYYNKTTKIAMSELFNKLTSGVRFSSDAGTDFVNRFCDIAMDMDCSQTKWISDLRKSGITAAHPDDGWVDRKNNTVRFVYPQFDKGIASPQAMGF
jgi:hypothetical protein